MATKFGRIDSSESSFEEQDFHKGQTLTGSSPGVHHIFGLKDHYKPGTADAGGGILSISGSHWAFAHNMFYMSGSQKVLETMPADADKFNSIYHNFNQHNDLKPFHTTKFHDTASIFYVPQSTFGERIQPGSFTLTARTGSASNTTKQIIIKDDRNGNLYSSNYHASRSSNDLGITGSMSSSVNYIGNIFYDLGMAVLTETASWSGSVNYMDIGNIVPDKHKTYEYWTLKFNSTTPIFTSQYQVRINAGEFNATTNATIKPYNGGDYMPSGSSIDDIANMKSDLTGSSWSPYFTQIALYRNQTEEPVMHANLPRAVKTRSDIDLIITFRVDH